VTDPIAAIWLATKCTRIARAEAAALASSAITSSANSVDEALAVAAQVRVHLDRSAVVAYALVERAAASSTDANSARRLLEAVLEKWRPQPSTTRSDCVSMLSSMAARSEELKKLVVKAKLAVTQGRQGTKD
jgi:hypothetical protein